MKFKIGITALLGITLTSCSGHYFKTPEVSHGTASHFLSAKEVSNLVPKLIVKDFTVKKKVKSRGLASVKSKRESSNQFHSNKGLYFISLYKNFLDFKSFTPKNSFADIQSCPVFHTGLLNFKEKYQAPNKTVYKKNFTASQLNDKFAGAHFPELMLPMTEDSLTPMAIDIAKENPSKSAMVIQNALVTHLAKMKKEIVELCQTGSSTNYYIYENLIGHIKKNGPLSADKKGMQILLKSTLFANMAIMKSIKKSTSTPSRGLASFSKKNNHDSQLMNRAKADWVEDYLKDLR